MILTLEEAAQTLKQETRVIAELARAGKIPANKVGGKWRFYYDDLIAWFRAGYKCHLKSEDASGTTHSTTKVSVTVEPQSVPTSGKRKHSRMSSEGWLEKESLADIL